MDRRSNSRERAGPRAVERVIEAPLPHNADAERSVLGAVLLDNKALGVAVELLQPADFFLPQHQRLYKRMLALGERQQPIDLVTLAEELDRAGELDAAGGPAYLAQLIDGVPRVSNVAEYAQIVKQKALLCSVIRTAEAIKLQAQAQDGDDSETILGRAAESFAELAKVSGQSGLRLFSAKEIVEAGQESKDYLIFPIALPGIVVEIDGLQKLAGKTTFVLSAIRAALGGESFLGRPARPIRALYVTEENPQTFAVALERTGLGDDHPDLRIVPFTQFGGHTWAHTAAFVERVCDDYGPSLVVLDTLFGVVQASPEQENDAGFAEQAIRPIRQLAGRRNVAVIVTRHERKAGGEVGVSGRGSGALSGAVDIVAQLQRLPREGPTRRRLSFVGRIGADILEIELLPDGRFVLVESSGPAKFDLASELFDAGVSVRDVAAELKISKTAAGRLRGRWEAERTSRCPTVPLSPIGTSGTGQIVGHEPGQSRDKSGTDRDSRDGDENGD